jgi:hypothetical protein
MPFVDGEPIDAGKLTALETKVNILQSKIPTFGGSNTNINIDNSTTSSVVSTGPEIEAGLVDPIKIESSKKVYDVTFKKTFTKKPVVVISLRGGESSNIISARVLGNSVSANGFKYVISAPTNTYTGTASTNIAINYIAIAY